MLTSVVSVRSVAVFFINGCVDIVLFFAIEITEDTEKMKIKDFRIHIAITANVVLLPIIFVPYCGKKTIIEVIPYTLPSTSE